MTFAHTYLRGRFSQQRSSTDKRRTLQFRPFCRRTSWGYSGFSDFEAHLSQGRFRQYNLICMRHAVESLGRPAPFATCYMVGREDKRTNNRTMLPTLKTMQLQVIKVQWKQSFEMCRLSGKPTIWIGLLNLQLVAHYTRNAWDLIAGVGNVEWR